MREQQHHTQKSVRLSSGLWSAGIRFRQCSRAALSQEPSFYPEMAGWLVLATSSHSLTALAGEKVAGDYQVLLAIDTRGDNHVVQQTWMKKKLHLMNRAAGFTNKIVAED